MGTIAIGIITLSALLMKFAKLHRATMREVRVNQRIFMFVLMGASVLTSHIAVRKNRWKVRNVGVHIFLC